MSHVSPKPQLITQVLAVNAVLLCAALAAVVAVATASDLQAPGGHARLLVVGAAALATVLVNGLVLRRRLEPLDRVRAALDAVDFGADGDRPRLPEPDSQEVARLHGAFERLLDRLEAERGRTAALVLRAQEGERARLARDLHDEANQALTGVLLRLQASTVQAPPDLRDELRETQAVATRAMEELVRLARELRPAALDDLGLAAALRTQVDAFARRARIAATLELGRDAVERLDRDAQLVAYRVVQEALSNVARHAGAESVAVAVGHGEAGTVAVRVRDDGHGFDPSATAADGVGLKGMRERAALAGGRLTVTSAPGAGTTIELRLPAEAAR